MAGWLGAASGSSLWRESGLVRPLAPGGAWLRDRHFIGALLAAVPVWLALGLGLGGTLQGPAGWRAWLSFALVQPFVEEVVFRGILQGQALRLSAARRIGALTLANIGTTSAFVALHLIAQPPAWALAVAGPSLLFGHIRERLGSAWPAVLLHAVFNAGFGLVAWASRH